MDSECAQAIAWNTSRTVNCHNHKRVCKHDVRTRETKTYKATVDVWALGTLKLCRRLWRLHDRHIYGDVRVVASDVDAAGVVGYMAVVSDGGGVADLRHDGGGRGWARESFLGCKFLLS